MKKLGWSKRTMSVLDLNTPGKKGQSSQFTFEDNTKQLKFKSAKSAKYRGENDLKISKSYPPIKSSE